MSRTSLRNLPLAALVGGFFYLWGSAFAQQTVLQGGSWTSGHVPMYASGGGSTPFVQDSGPAGGGNLGSGISELLRVVRGAGNGPYANGGTGPLKENDCNYDAPLNNVGGYHYLCFSPNAQGGGLIDYGYAGGATPLPLNVVINGTTFPFSPGGGTVGVGTQGQIAGYQTAGSAVTGVTVAAPLTFGSPWTTISLATTGKFTVTGSALDLATAGASAGTYSNPVVTVNAQGQVTSISNGSTGSGTVNSGLSGQMTYYAADGTAVSGNANANIANGTLTLGQASSVNGGIVLEGATSGAATIATQSVANTPTLTLPNASGTFAVSASSPLALSATTGALTCATCATTTSGGALSATSPMTISSGGVIALASVTSTQGNGTKVQLSTGTPTGGNMTAFDGSDNTVDAGFSMPSTGTSGGIPYYSSATAISSSALLTQYGIVYGGGAAASPVAMAKCGTNVPVVGSATAPVCSPGSLVLASGKTLTVNNTLTLSGTDSTTMTFPSTTATIARTDAGQTFTGTQTFSTPIAATSIAAAPLASGSSTGNTLTAPIGYFVCTAACTVTPPVPAAGYQFCVMNADNTAGVITMGAIGSSARYENTGRTAYGTAGTGTLSSAGAAADMVCIVGLDSTHYLTTTYVGTWTAS